MKDSVKVYVWRSVQVATSGAPEQALLLDFLHHSTAARAASLAPGAATLCTLRWPMPPSPNGGTGNDNAIILEFEALSLIHISCRRASRCTSG